MENKFYQKDSCREQIGNFIYVNAVEMVRKDFEALYTVGKIINTFNSSDFSLFSKEDDDYLSIKHVTETAFNCNVEQLDLLLWELIQEIGIIYAFKYAYDHGNELAIIKESSKTIVDLIFDCSREISVDKAILKLIGGYKQSFPKRENPYIENTEIMILNKNLREGEQKQKDLLINNNFIKDEVFA